MFQGCLPNSILNKSVSLQTWCLKVYWFGSLMIRFWGAGLQTQAGWNMGLDTSGLSVIFVHLDKPTQLQGRPTYIPLYCLKGCLSKGKVLEALTKANFRCGMLDSLCALFRGGDWSGMWTRCFPIPSLFPAEGWWYRKASARTAGGRALNSSMHCAVCTLLEQVS